MTATKHSPFSISPLIAMTMVMLLTPTAVQAWYYGGYNAPYYGYGQSHHGSHDYRHGYGHSSYRRSHNDAYRRSYASRDTVSQDCHATSKIGYLDGVKGKIGGTMCYDSYGDAFIVPGSRYLIEHY